MNQVTTRTPTLPGLLPNEDALELARGFEPTMDGSVFELNRMPTTVERQSLLARSQEIAAALEPCGSRGDTRLGAAEAVAGLLVGYGYARNDKRSEQTIAIYVTHLSPVPLFAIQAAVEDVKAGRVYDVDPRTGNKTFLSPDKEPSTIRLRAVADKHVQRLAAEKWEFDKVLSAKRALPAPPTGAERERVQIGLQKMKTDIQRRASEKAVEVAAAHGVDLEANRKKMAADLVAGAERLIVAEYEALGLAPVRGGDGTLVSLSMMKASGYRVAETNFGGDVKRELVR